MLFGQKHEIAGWIRNVQPILVKQARRSQRFKIWQFLVAISLFAVLCSIVGGLLALVLLPLVGVYGFFLWRCQPSRRWGRIAWILATYPLLAIAMLYATWITAWVTLGHSPRPSIDDPKDIAAISIPYNIAALLLGASPVVFVAFLSLLFVEIFKRRQHTFSEVVSKFLPVLAFPIIWISSFAFLMLDPLRVLYWYMD